MKLLKIFTVSALLLSAVTVSHAQETPKSKVGIFNSTSFGVKAGANFSTVTGGSFNESPDYKTGFHAGLVAEIPIADNIFSIQPEVLYSTQGFKSNDALLGKSEYKLDYITVPVLAKLYVVKGLSFEVGPQMGFKVNEKIDLKGADAQVETNSAKDFEVGVAGGLTFKTDMGLFATGRYTYGLTDTFKNDSAKNSVFQVGLGFMF
ncbi:porin family protein [Flavobacterium sp. '19STA2R22 D10 B1']|uniref:porin family protein n=1 Tax=Flavobacterium aerium TaxID=3037261 RepID=UPI00278BC281|nr:porin family protein [Flavobacterium sp. '19STA2R22 D10 B1']